MNPALSLAIIDLSNPLFWAVFIGWILSVVLHEFAHGFVAYLGGDYTIRERGGMTLNPLQYVHPVYSLLMPAIFFAMGGIPLPGGVNYVRRDLIKNRAWQVAVSAAGPAMTFLLFLACALPFHPKIHLIHPNFLVLLGASDYLPNWHQFFGTMAILELLAVIFNLVPVPPLDGFQMIAPLLPVEVRHKLQHAGSTLFLIFFLALFSVPALSNAFFSGTFKVMSLLGFDELTIDYFKVCFTHLPFPKAS